MNYNGLLDINVLADYLDGKLDTKSMPQVEKLSLEDPFVAEALAGLSESSTHRQSLSLLQKQLHQRIAQKPIEKKRWIITSQRLSIASAAAVLFIVVGVLFFLKENSRKQMDANQVKNVKIEIAPENKIENEAKPLTKADKEIDKALALAKTNTYASNKKSKDVAKASEPVVAAEVDAVVAEKSQVSMMENMAMVKRVDKKSISAPINGWEKFEEYILKRNKLIKNNQLTGKSVQLSFIVNEANRPTDIKVLKGLSKEENDEAIRLLNEGPGWEFIRNKTESILIDIKF